MSDSFSAITQTVASAAGVGPWYAMLRQASFRGASFHVEQGSAASGRRAALHEYPGRDIPYTEDLGRKQWQYTFSAYCIGPVYPLQRDALLRACTTKGAGTLVHPSFGSKQVVCTDISVTEERQSGNYCSFSLTFAEAGQLQVPNASTNTVSAIGSSAIGSAISSVSDFVSHFSVEGVESFVAEAAGLDVSSFCADMQALNIAPIVGTAFQTALGSLSHNASSLVYNASALATGVQAVTSSFGDASGASSAFGSMLTLASGFTSHTFPDLFGTTSGTGASTQSVAAMSYTTTTARQREAANAAAFQRLVRESALVEVAYAVPGLELQSSQDALNVRNAVLDAFEAAEIASGNAGLDDSYVALIKLENDVLAHITRIMLQLPALTTYRFPQSPNALALAWRLYQDAERNLELVDRTGAINPAFMPRTGQVLTS